MEIQTQSKNFINKMKKSELLLLQLKTKGNDKYFHVVHLMRSVYTIKKLYKDFRTQ